LDLPFCKAIELSAVKIVDPRVQPLQKRKSLRRDGDSHNAAVVRAALALDKAAILQPVEHAGEVRNRSQQTLTQHSTGEWFALISTQNPEYIVLWVRQFLFVEQPVYFPRQPVTESDDCQHGVPSRLVRRHSGFSD